MEFQQHLVIPAETALMGSINVAAYGDAGVLSTMPMAAPFKTTLTLAAGTTSLYFVYYPHGQIGSATLYLDKIPPKLNFVLSAADPAKLVNKID